MPYERITELDYPTEETGETINIEKKCVGCINLKSNHYCHVANQFVYRIYLDSLKLFSNRNPGNRYQDVVEQKCKKEGIGMERRYYTINEQLARQANDMMSFREYRDGSLTEGYKLSVDEIYQIAENVAKTNEAGADKAYRFANLYAKLLSDYYNKNINIKLMCPSVIIAGPSNFPIRKKEKQMQAWELNDKRFAQCNEIKEKLIKLLKNNDSGIILSNDSDAIEKIKDRIEKLEKNHENMKAINVYFRKNKTCKGFVGLTDEEAENLDSEVAMACSWDKQPYPSYHLSNNKDVINRLKKRADLLEKIKSKPTSEIQHKGLRIVENTEIMRFQLLFDDKQDAKKREILKSNGLCWSPKESAWQMHLTSSGRIRINKVLKELEKC